MTDTKKYHATNISIEEKQAVLYRERKGLYQWRHTLTRDDPRWIIASFEIDSVTTVLDQLDDERRRNFESHQEASEKRRKRQEYEAQFYKRSDKSVSGLFSKLLPPLPGRASRISVKDVTFEKVPAYRLLPIVLYAVIWGSVGALLWAFPWLRFGPLSMLRPITSTPGAALLAVVLFACTMYVGVCVIVMVTDMRLATDTLRAMASEDAQRFRMGAESWTYRQRVRSCVIFSVCNPVSYIFPLVAIPAHVLLAAVLLLVYIQNCRSSNSTHYATVASAKVHTGYNYCVYGGTLLLFVVGAIVSLV